MIKEEVLKVVLLEIESGKIRDLPELVALVHHELDESGGISAWHRAGVLNSIKADPRVKVFLRKARQKAFQGVLTKDTPLLELPLPARVANRLGWARMVTLGDVFDLFERGGLEGFLAIRNIGELGVKEITALIDWANKVMAQQEAASRVRAILTILVEGDVVPLLVELRRLGGNETEEVPLVRLRAVLKAASPQDLAAALNRLREVAGVIEVKAEEL